MNCLKYYTNKKHLKYFKKKEGIFDPVKTYSKLILTEEELNDKKDEKYYRMYIYKNKTYKNISKLLDNRKVNLNFIKDISHPNRIFKNNFGEHLLLFDLLAYSDLSVPYKKRLFSYLSKNESFLLEVIKQEYIFDWLSSKQKEKIESLRLIHRFL